MTRVKRLYKVKIGWDTSSMNFAIKKSTLKLTLLLLLFKAALDLAYVYVISPVYAYSGFTIAIDFLALIESYILTLIIGFMVPSNIGRPSHFFIWMLAVGALIPSLTYYAIHSGSRMFMYMLVLSFICVVVMSKIALVKIGTLKEGRVIGIGLLIATVIIVAVSMIVKGGLSHFNLNISKVYEHRRDVGALIGTGLWGYINTWAFKVINPALIGWAFWQNRTKLVLAFSVLQILFFGISSHKSVLFYPALILVLYLFAEKRKALNLMTWGLIVVIIVSSAVSILIDYHWLSSLFIRRVFLVPASLNFVYYELFSRIGHVFMSNSVLSWLFEYPFHVNPVLLVSEYLYGHQNTWANNGFLATGYMHFGFLGMIIFSLIVGVLLWLLDILVYRRLPLWLGISIVTMPIFSLFTSADLTTALLTHGILVGMLVLLVLGNKQNVTEKEIKQGAEAYLSSDLGS